MKIILYELHVAVLKNYDNEILSCNLFDKVSIGFVTFISKVINARSKPLYQKKIRNKYKYHKRVLKQICFLYRIDGNRADGSLYGQRHTWTPATPDEL